jgi:hypothetical protein
MFSLSNSTSLSLAILGTPCELAISHSTMLLKKGADDRDLSFGASDVLKLGI